LAFLTRNKAKMCKILMITLVFEKNANFIAENCQKSPKIVIITSTPGPEVDVRISLHFLPNKIRAQTNNNVDNQCFDHNCITKKNSVYFETVPDMENIRKALF
jgi:hypothetical protein